MIAEYTIGTDYVVISFENNKYTITESNTLYKNVLHLISAFNLVKDSERQLLFTLVTQQAPNLKPQTIPSPLTGDEIESLQLDEECQCKKCTTCSCQKEANNYCDEDCDNCDIEDDDEELEDLNCDDSDGDIFTVNKSVQFIARSEGEKDKYATISIAKLELDMPITDYLNDGMNVIVSVQITKKKKIEIIDMLGKVCRDGKHIRMTWDKSLGALGFARDGEARTLFVTSITFPDA